LTVSALTKIALNVDAIKAVEETRNGTGDLSIGTRGDGSFANLLDGADLADGERERDDARGLDDRWSDGLRCGTRE